MNNLKVQPGDPLSARKWNGVVEQLPVSRIGNGARLSVNRTTAQIRNDSGSDRELGELLAIDDYLGPDDDEFRSIDQALIFSGVDPVWHSKIARLVVLAEPIPDGDWGEAVVKGICVAKLASGSNSDPHVMVDPTNVNQMRGATSGCGKLVRVTTTGGYAVIDLGETQREWRYSLNEAVGATTSGQASADLLGLDETDTGGDVTVIDDLGIMADQGSGDFGSCVQAGNKFYARQGPCS